MTPGDDITLRSFVGYNMKRAFNVIQSDVNASLAPLGLRMVTFSALAVIRDNPGLRQSQLADILLIERPNLVVLIDELERADLITRERDQEDRRAYRLQVTELGETVCSEAVASIRAHEARLTEGLSDADCARLAQLLQTIETNASTRRSDD